MLYHFDKFLYQIVNVLDGISSTTIQLLLTGSMHKMHLIKRMSAILQKISRRSGMSQVWPVVHLSDFRVTLQS